MSPLIRARVAAEFELDAEARDKQGADPELRDLVASLLAHIDFRMRKLRGLPGLASRTVSLAHDGRLSWPLAFGLVTSGFGTRKDPLHPSRDQYHEGLDLAAPPHEPVYAATAGTVVFVGRNAGYGRMVRIRHAGDLETVYAHLAATLVAYDQEVTRGQVVGLLGRSGRTTGHHLHFGVYHKGKAVDPMRHLRPIPMSFSDSTPGVLFGHPEEP
jgi:murein DD-endopeptidase MepM/ murein hydrolase activator NlpD